MALKCHNNWFDGAEEDYQFFNAAVPGAPLLAQMTALGVALGKVGAKIAANFGLPCPKGCNYKTGSYSLQTNIQFKRLKKGEAVKCTVAWLLVVSCSELEGAGAGEPFAQDWSVLYKEFIKEKNKKP